MTAATDRRPVASTPSRGRPVLVWLVVWTAASGCARLGYTDRVLLRVPSPTTGLVAVCQEVPEFDGPGFTIRLEALNGAVVRQLYQAGDADGCSEMAWSPDGRLLAVLTAHVARIRFVDVEWALAHAPTTTAYWSWRQVDLGTERQLTLGRGLRMMNREEFELQTCAYTLAVVRHTGTWECIETPVTRRLTVPQPVVTAIRYTCAARSGARRPVRGDTQDPRAGRPQIRALVVALVVGPTFRDRLPRNHEGR